MHLGALERGQGIGQAGRSPFSFMTKIKVYAVIPTDRDGNVTGKPVGVKLTRGAAQALAKRHAPCMVEMYLADKSAEPDQHSQQASKEEALWP